MKNLLSTVSLSLIISLHAYAYPQGDIKIKFPKHKLTKPDVDIVYDYDAKKFVGKYVLLPEYIKDMEHKELGKFVLIAMKRTDIPNPEPIAFSESSPMVNAEIIKSATSIEVQLDREKKELVVTFFKNKEPFFVSKLSSFKQPK